MDRVVEWGGELHRLAWDSGPWKAELSPAQAPSAYEAAWRVVFGSSLTKDEWELKYIGSHRQMDLEGFLFAKIKFEMQT